MGKKVNHAVIDAQTALAAGTHIHVCSGEPANYAGIAAIELASAAISGSTTVANGDTSGRKRTTPAQSGVSITQSGTGNHIVESDGTSEIKKVTTFPATALTSGGTVDIAAYDHEIQDPV